MYGCMLHKNIVFTVPMETGSEKLIYLRLQSNDPIAK